MKSEHTSHFCDDLRTEGPCGSAELRVRAVWEASVGRQHAESRVLIREQFLGREMGVVARAYTEDTIILLEVHRSDKQSSSAFPWMRHRNWR